MQIPFSPPFVDDDVKKEVIDSLDSGWITTGPKVKALEQEVAKYCGIDQVLGVNSATSGLMLVLHWFGIGKGDEVIIPAYTYCATALVVMHLGAKPVMVDVDEDFNISVSNIEKAITSKTKAIMPVDFAGWPCDYHSIFNLVNKPEIKSQFIPTSDNQKKLGRILVLSDAAHSFGATYHKKAVGSLADITVLSFHAVKNLTTAEGGGICITMPAPFNNAEIYATLRLWSLNGQTKDAFSKTKIGGWRYDIVYPGFKMNMPDVCAAIGLAQVRKYDASILNERKRVFDYYKNFFQKTNWAFNPPYNSVEKESSYHLYPLRIKNITEEQRDKIIDIISSTGVAVNVHFIPLPMLSIFKERNYKIEDFPIAYNNFKSEISLPIYPQLNENLCKIIVTTVSNAVNEVLKIK
jgi:dTDP-4-amino-4,6-dideoxygalactose transaminase